MAMTEHPLKGDLSQTSFPRLLFHIWKRKKTGCLHLEIPKSDFRLFFRNGSISAEKQHFSEDDFFKAQVEKKHLGPLDYENSLRYAEQKKTSLIKAYLEIHNASAGRLWEQMKDYLCGEFFPFFDDDRAAFHFDSEYHFPDSHVFFQIYTPLFILDGIRGMKNHKRITSFLHPLNTPVRVLSPSWSEELVLSSAEKYMMHLTAEYQTVEGALKNSDISEKESLISVFALACLGFLIFSQKPGHDSLLDEYLPLDFERILSVFNTNCSLIHKYISKEIGPVSVNVLKKCLEEIKPSLPPVFQKIELGPDGSISLNSHLRAKFKLFSHEEKRGFIEGLNEILAAEVLAVKRVFGSDHESKIIKNLVIWKE